MRTNYMNRKVLAMALPALLLLVMAPPVFAEGTITIASRIPYANDDVGRDAIRTQCTWNSDLPAALVARSNGKVVSTDQDLATIRGKKLIMTTTDIHAMGGGGFSGPKWIVVHGELSEDGKVLGNFDFRRVTSHGKMTVCGTLDYIGKALTNNILIWLENPTMNADSGDPVTN